MGLRSLFARHDIIHEAPAPEPPADNLICPGDLCVILGTFSAYPGLVKNTNVDTQYGLVRFFDEAFQEFREVWISAQYIAPYDETLLTGDENTPAFTEALR